MSVWPESRPDEVTPNFLNILTVASREYRAQCQQEISDRWQAALAPPPPPRIESPSLMDAVPPAPPSLGTTPLEPQAALATPERQAPPTTDATSREPKTAHPNPTAIDASPSQARPTPLTTNEISLCFDGVRWPCEKWKKALGKKAQWLAACIASEGQRGVRERRWYPVLLGAALVRGGYARPNTIRARFQTKLLLNPWLDDWKTYEADNFNTA